MWWHSHFKAGAILLLYSSTKHNDSILMPSYHSHVSSYQIPRSTSSNELSSTSSVDCFSAKKDALVVVRRRWDLNSATRQIHMMNLLPNSQYWRRLCDRMHLAKVWEALTCTHRSNKNKLADYIRVPTISRLQWSSECQSCPINHRVPWFTEWKTSETHLNSSAQKNKFKKPNISSQLLWMEIFNNEGSLVIQVPKLEIQQVQANIPTRRRIFKRKLREGRDRYTEWNIAWMNFIGESEYFLNVLDFQSYMTLCADQKSWRK